MTEIIEATRNNYDSLKKLKRNEWKRILKRVEKGERKLFLLMRNDDILGYVTLNFKPKYQVYKRMNIPEIQDLYIDTNHRRKGYGSMLVDYCEKHCEDNDYKQVGISVSVSPKFGVAQQMYIARGYNVDGNGVTYERRPLMSGMACPVDDDLCLMMIKQF